MKRLLTVLTLLLVCIPLASASITWSNESYSFFHPQLFTSGCNSSDTTTITASHVPEGSVFSKGISGSYSLVGGYSTWTNGYLTDQDTGAGYYATYADSRQGVIPHYYATCDPAFSMDNNLADNTPSTAYYIGTGQIKRYTAVGYGTVLDDAHNMTYNSSPSYYYDNDDQVTVIFGLRIDPTKEDPRWIKMVGHNAHYYTGSWWNPTANFTATPLNGTGPLQVLFTDTSINATGTLTYNWSTSPNTSVYMYPPSGLTEDVQMIFTQNGNYTVTHGIQNQYGSSIETKTDYIWVYNSSNMITSTFTAIDSFNGYDVHGANISVNDVENNSWVNSTFDADGTVSITTLYGHTINAYASALGYTDGENLGVDNIFNSVDYSIPLQPIGYYNVSDGNVTLHIRVEDGDTFQPVTGAGVTATFGGGPSFSIMTNAQGYVDIVAKNNTVYNVRATKSGYKPGTQNVNTGIASGGDTVVSVTVLIYKDVITATPTVTTLPGGGTPAPTTTYLEHCNPNAEDYDQDDCRTENAAFSLSWLADNMLLLVQICFIFTILYIAGWKP